MGRKVNIQTKGENERDRLERDKAKTKVRWKRALQSFYRKIQCGAIPAKKFGPPQKLQKILIARKCLDGQF